MLAAVPALPAVAAETARSFIQVTILGSDPSKGTLKFLDASGRQRVERATGEALQALAVVRPGDQAILSMTSDAGSPVVTRIRRARRAEPAAQIADASAPSETPSASARVPMAVSAVPVRRSWPNPYRNPPR